jgi:hypothetical protein
MDAISKLIRDGSCFINPLNMIMRKLLITSNNEFDNKAVELKEEQIFFTNY